MPSPRVSPVTRPKSVSTPTLPVGIEVMLHRSRSKTTAAITIRRTPPPRKLGMLGNGPEYPLRESAMFSPVRTTGRIATSLGIPTFGSLSAIAGYAVESMLGQERWSWWRVERETGESDNPFLERYARRHWAERKVGTACRPPTFVDAAPVARVPFWEEGYTPCFLQECVGAYKSMGYANLKAHS